MTDEEKGRILLRTELEKSKGARLVYLHGKQQEGVLHWDYVPPSTVVIHVGDWNMEEYAGDFPSVDLVANVQLAVLSGKKDEPIKAEDVPKPWWWKRRGHT